MLASGKCDRDILALLKEVGGCGVRSMERARGIEERKGDRQEKGREREVCYTLR